MNTICYLIYGVKRDYQLELTYSVASLHRFIGANAEAWRIVLITDEANRREDLPVEHLIFSPEEFANWTGHGHYHHAAKVHALIKAVGNYGGKTALVDTDTYFRLHPATMFDHIGAGRTVMHATDGVLGQFAEWLPILQATNGSCQGYKVEGSSVMFNSGVVGLDQTEAHLLADVLSLMTTLYGMVPVFNIEQFAFSAVLGKHTALRTCPDVLAHYWGPERRFFHAHIGALFPRFSRKAFDHLAEAFIVFGYPRKRRLDQLSARLKTVLRRQDSDYRFAYLAYRSALACGVVRPIDADAWARIAADILNHRQFPPGIVASDFKSMRDSAKNRWMSAETSAVWRLIWDKKTAASSSDHTPLH